MALSALSTLALLPISPIFFFFPSFGEYLLVIANGDGLLSFATFRAA
jgi:hypothetical protein